jgi:hypothetical protein
MKMRLELTKDGTTLADEAFDVSDAESFAQACGELWMRLEKRRLDSSANVGELMDRAGEGVARELDGAELRFSKV